MYRVHPYSLIAILLLSGCENLPSPESKTNSKHLAHNHGDSSTGTSEHGEILNSVVEPPNVVVLSDQNTFIAQRVDTTFIIEAYGRIIPDQRRNRKVAVRSAGRVEKLYVKYDFQHLSAGQKILDLYTPEINTYAAEYLHHLKTPGDDSLITLSRRKLLLLGVNTEQLDHLVETGKVSETLTLFSPESGYVLFNYEQNESGISMQNGTAANMQENGNMSNMAADKPEALSYSVPGEKQLREGAYVNKGQTLFNINDLRTVWGIVSFDQSAESFLKKGATVEIKSELLTHPLLSSISFLEPVYNSKRQKFTQARIYLPNHDGKLKINSLFKATTFIRLRDELIVPASSVFTLGKRNIIWVQSDTSRNGKHVFRARNVVVGIRTKDLAVIKSNLLPGEYVARDAGYLIDSQSLIEP